MKIDTAIADAYLNLEDVSRFSTMWLYTDRTERGIENVFHAPPQEEGKRKTVLRIKEELLSHAATFVPCNVQVWDALFCNWRKALDEVTLNLIVGYPPANDATVKRSPDGEYHMIFDLLCWEKYLGKIPLPDVSQNLLTHELFHVMLERQIPDIAAAETEGQYIQQLDAIAFNEGFAHLVSYNRQQIDRVAWDGEPLTAVYVASARKMREALREKSPEKQKRYVYEANFGNYYDKFACMCAMIYLGRQWQIGGTPLLKALFDQGFHGFAGKCAGL